MKRMVELIFNVDADVDFDSTENAWEYYKRKYKMDKELNVQGKLIKVNGECVFNFGSKYRMLMNIITNDENLDHSKKQALLQKLDICRKLHHSLPNIMVLPQRGGLNTLKGKIYYSSENSEWRVKKGGFRTGEWFDRPDTLVYYIKEYYEKKQCFDKMSFKDIGEYLSNGVFTSAIIQGETFTQLIDILDIFDGIEGFCSLFYQIDKPMINNWLDNRVKCLVKDDVEGYLNQALDFWSIQMKYIFEMLINEDMCICINGESVKEYVIQQLANNEHNGKLIIEGSEGKYILKK